MTDKKIKSGGMARQNQKCVDEVVAEEDAK